MFLSTTVKHLNPKGVQFSLFLPDEVKQLSIVKINVPISFNALGRPMKGGLYDPCMGPTGEKNELCTTCHKTVFNCPGHFGHIELPLPVFNPMFYKTVYTILRFSCLKCYQLQVPAALRNILIAQLRLLDAGYMTEAQDLVSRMGVLLSEDNKATEDIQQAFVKEEMSAYVSQIIGDKTIEPSLEQSKNVEALRNHYLKSVLHEISVKNECTCRSKIPKITLMQNKLMTTVPKDSGEGKVISQSETTIITADEARNHLRKLWVDGADFMSALAPVLQNCNIPHPTDLFFIEVVPVPPPKARPVNFLKGVMMEHPQTVAFQKVVEQCVMTRHVIRALNDGNSELSEEDKRMFDMMKGTTSAEKLHHTWQALQRSVDQLVDSDMGGGSHGDRQAGLKQVISKKEGLIRMHMMGKRVNFAGRTVITPDPNLGVDEIGIPEVFAKALTYPTPVTPWNVSVLRTAIINGPAVHPGATLVQDGKSVVRVDATQQVQRESLAKRLLTPGDTPTDGCKVVHRHLLTGDVLLLNRQPTLHRPSIMAHRARILRGERTLRLHYANCKAYNADFDGDEMNVHFPQNELARGEAYHLAEVGRQYLVPKDGTPLSGLIQDHVIGGVRLTLRGRFFSHGDYCGLVAHALPAHTGPMRLLPPAMLRPKRLWSGKQIFSTVLLNVLPVGRTALSLCDTAKISVRAWQRAPARGWRAGGTALEGHSMSETEVVIRQGELLCGVLDKKHYGSTPFGLAHCVYELYGGTACMRLLSALGRLFTAFLQLEGFTLGVRDILVVPAADAIRHSALAEARQLGPGAEVAGLELPEDEEERHHQREERLAQLAAGDKQLRAALDHAYKKLLDPCTDSVSKACLPAGLLTGFPENNLQLMVQSGAKGSTVNTLQISCLLGQIELEGRRPPLMPSGKSLPSFRRFDSSPRAGGFVDGRFMTGIRPQEFFFHCMAGREGLIDTAVKTSRSGYLQRCLVKHLEGLVVGYDGMVHDSDGSVVQWRYGEDGLDVMRAQFLNLRQLGVLTNNQAALNEPKAAQRLREEVEKHPVLQAQHEKVRKWLKRQKRLASKNGVIQKQKRRSHHWPRTPEPVAALARPDQAQSLLSERLEALLAAYLAEHPNADSVVARHVLAAESARAQCEPGEPVGVLAAQSLGEPSTQMTLNTFHFAGRGEMNVTLGIPRLREILMLASRNIKTPSMEIPVQEGPNSVADANALRRRLRRTLLSDVLERVDVSDWLEASGQKRQHVYCLRLQTLPPSEYSSQHSVEPHQVLRHVELSFLRQLFSVLQRRLNMSRSAVVTAAADDPAKAGGKESENGPDAALDDPTLAEDAPPEGQLSSDEEAEGFDDDATVARRRARHCEDVEYESEEEEEAQEAKEQDLGEEQVQLENGDLDKGVPARSKRDRRTEVVNRYPIVTEYKYDKQRELWCEVTFRLPLTHGRQDLSCLIREQAQKSVVWETFNIRRAFTYTSPETQTFMLKTDGINIVEMFKYSNVLDLNRLYSNDIHAISQTYGIEAARRVLVREVKDVFKVYGITVDPRHLLLVADYMTFSGSFEPLSRRGMEAGCSPLQQMSFESSLVFLQSAALRGRKDLLQSPSSRIMLGRPCAAGTGTFSLRHRFIPCT